MEEDWDVSTISDDQTYDSEQRQVEQGRLARRERANHLYKNAWEEYNNARSKENVEILKSLQINQPMSNPESVSDILFSIDAPSDPPSFQSGGQISVQIFGSVPLSFTVQPKRITQLVEMTSISPKVFPNLPPYNFTTPSSRTMDVFSSSRCYKPDICPFVPLADDASFVRDHMNKYLDLFESFAWEVDFQDPDVEEIQRETFRRLLANGMSHAEIDDLDIGLPRLRENNKSGLLWQTNQRDSVPPSDFMTSDSTALSNLIESFKPTDLERQLEIGMSTFCPRLACITHKCGIHEREYTSGDDIQTFSLAKLWLPAPKLTSTKMRNKYASFPCGPECFLVDDREYLREPIDDADVQHILKMFPDTCPCEVARICGRPCNGIWNLRARMFIDEDLQLVERLSKLEIQPKPSKALDPLPSDSPARKGPCRHKGYCTEQNVLCVCMNNNQHCQQVCGCPMDCIARWKGCGNICGKKVSGQRRSGRNPAVELCGNKTKCPCAKAERECDPLLCTGCNARYLPELLFTFISDNDGFWIAEVPNSSQCRNVPIQKGYPNTFFHKGPVELVVQRGSYGMGTFLKPRQSIPGKCYIGEYVGELIRIGSPEEDRRSTLQRHDFRKNYFFALDDAYIIDAGRMGNATRFLNDNFDKRKLNVSPYAILVNGEYRIGLQSKRSIRGNEELFFSYGKGYWHHLQGDDNDDSENSSSS